MLLVFDRDPEATFCDYYGQPVLEIECGRVAGGPPDGSNYGNLAGGPVKAVTNIDSLSGFTTVATFATVSSVL
ncbi:hypothetical protein GCM10010869_18820 [Mesorhizobium tianshanense]|nr:hypothetical protein GCM10010869_18820 [Mesorhizobium tianshanense]